MWSSWLAPSVAEWTISVAWLYFSILHALRLDATRTFNLVWQRRAAARDGQGGLVRVGDILYSCRESFGGTRGLGYRRDAETWGGAALLHGLRYMSVGGHNGSRTQTARRHPRGTPSVCSIIVCDLRDLRAAFCLLR
jgi:hypothetical protein